MTPVKPLRRRKRRNLETRQRQSKAYKRAEREANCKLLALPEISHEAAEQVLRSQATLSDEKFSWYQTRQSPALPLTWPRQCFFCKQCAAVNAGGTLRLLKSLCDGTGESDVVTLST